jgi:hypothetical protein
VLDRHSNVYPQQQPILSVPSDFCMQPQGPCGDFSVPFPYVSLIGLCAVLHASNVGPCVCGGGPFLYSIRNVTHPQLPTHNERHVTHMLNEPCTTCSDSGSCKLHRQCTLSSSAINTSTAHFQQTYTRITKQISHQGEYGDDHLEEPAWAAKGNPCVKVAVRKHQNMAD